MGRGEDRINNLPNEVLQSILCLLPLKYAIRTSILSKRWIHLWKFNLISSTSLQFGEDFSCNQSPKQFAATLDRYLQLHGDRNLDKFGFLFSPFEYFFPNLKNWVHVVLAKGVKELDIDLSQGVLNFFTDTYVDDRIPFMIPGALFDGNSLTRLCLSRCDISDAFDTTNFIGLNSLSLDRVNLTDEMLLNILENCVSLESISLIRCNQLKEAQFVGDNLKLKKLVMVYCPDVSEMEISVPGLESFVYHGTRPAIHRFVDISNVTDAYLSSVAVESHEELEDLLSDFSHVEVLTICALILDIWTALPTELPNLEELQVIMDDISKSHLCYLLPFFHACQAPSLEKLFIEFPSISDERVSDLAGDLQWIIQNPDKPDVVFQNRLKWIKITNFQGSPPELKLVKFLLEKAIMLEWIFLIMNQFDELNDSLSLRILQGQLSILPKASKHAQIVLCGSSDRDCMINPTHTIYYPESHRKGTTIHLDNETIGYKDIVVDQEFL